MHARPPLNHNETVGLFMVRTAKPHEVAATFPDRAGEVVMALLQAMGDMHARQLLASDVAGIIATQAAYMEAIERVLGASPWSLQRAAEQDVAPWIAAVHER